MTLGDKFTPEVKEAWGSMYGLVSNTMQGAMLLQMLSFLSFSTVGYFDSMLLNLQ